MHDDFQRFALDLERALAAREITAAFQPQIAVSDGSLVGVEALARWTHPERGPVSPEVFVELAERTGMLAELTARVLSEVAEDDDWFGSSVQLAVNVSASQLEDPTLYRMLDDLFAERFSDPRRLVVEVTESVRIEHPERVAGPLAALADAGVTVSVDDFGAGHSSFERVEALHATELKLDRSLVQPRSRRREVAQIVTEAHNRGMRVVGEGVERRDQFDRLIEAGCDRAQGFWIATPQPRESLVDWYRGWTRSRSGGGLSLA